MGKTVLQVPPKTVIGKALQYSLEQWSKLAAYLEHGSASIENNRAACAIKPFVIDRGVGFFHTRTSDKANAVD